MNDALTCRVLACVSAMTGVRVGDMLGWRKTSDVAWARQLAMALIYENGGASMNDVARIFNRHHTTALWAIQSVRERSEIYASDRETVQQLRKHLGL